VQNAPDLISFAPIQAQDDNQFSDFVGAAPVKQQDDGFSDFQGGAQPAQAANDQQSKINNIMQMMSMSSNTNPGTVKYAAFETMNDFDTP